MGRQRGCCCEFACLVMEDAFAYGDSSDIGGNWVEVSGDWSISSQTLQESGTSGAKVRATEATHWGGNVYIEVDTVSPAVGDVFRVYVDWVLGTSNYHFAQYEKTASNTWTISIHDKHGTTLDTNSITTVAPGSNIKLYVCFLEGESGSTEAQFSADIQYRDPLDADVWELTTPNSGKYYGLGNGGTSTIAFDNFEAYNPRHVNLACVSCLCSCLKNALPKTLTATVSATGSADCMDGVEITLTWSYADSGWLGTSGVSGGFDLELYCDFTNDDDDTYPGKNIYAIPIFNGDEGETACCPIYTGSSNAVLGSCGQYAESSSTCDPLSLFFGTWEIDDSSISCEMCGDISAPKNPGTYSITVTE